MDNFNPLSNRTDIKSEPVILSGNSSSFEPKALPAANRIVDSEYLDNYYDELASGASNFSGQKPKIPFLEDLDGEIFRGMATEQNRELFKTYWKNFKYRGKNGEKFLITDIGTTYVCFKRNYDLNKVNHDTVKCGWLNWLEKMNYLSGSDCIIFEKENEWN